MTSCANVPCSRRGSSPRRAGMLGRVIGAGGAGTNGRASSGWSESRQNPTTRRDSPWMTWLGRGLARHDSSALAACEAIVTVDGVVQLTYLLSVFQWRHLGWEFPSAKLHKPRRSARGAPRTLTHQRLGEETLLLGALEPSVAQQLRCTGSATASAYIPTDRSSPADPVHVARGTHRCAGSLSKHTSTNSFICLLYPPTSLSRVGAALIAIWVRISDGVPRELGGTPCASSGERVSTPVDSFEAGNRPYVPRMVIPRLQMSAFASYLCPMITSGAIQLGYAV
jgi:hypothetical protein